MNCLSHFSCSGISEAFQATGLLRSNRLNNNCGRKMPLIVLILLSPPESPRDVGEKAFLWLFPHKQTSFLTHSTNTYSLVIMLPTISGRTQLTREFLEYEPKHLTYFKIPSVTGIIILRRIFLQPGEKIIHFFSYQGESRRVGRELTLGERLSLTAHFLMC